VFRARCEQQREYGVYLLDGCLEAGGMLGDVLAARRTLVVTTPTVWSLYGPRLQSLTAAVAADVEFLVLEVDEQTKSTASVLRICDACHAVGLGRTDGLLALGGGVCCDLVTVAASLVRRGLPYVCVPTTLVGQIDAGIGIKGAVNHRNTKSYLGSFMPPDRVLVDPAFLRTAPAETRLERIMSG
jgi:3-dehydroquinate synthase